jgi:hypothetical protein
MLFLRSDYEAEFTKVHMTLSDLNQRAATQSMIGLNNNN